MNAPQRHAERFYALLRELEVGLGGMRVLGECHGRMDWPERGVYFFFNRDELRSEDPGLRVVRVGTHAVSRTRGSGTRLWTRLRQHRGYRDGGGNHRGSVFRRHVGAALARRSRRRIVVTTWGKGTTPPGNAPSAELALERRVSEYLAGLRLLWVNVPDPPGPESDRARIERNAVALLAGPEGPLDPASPGWLGHHSPHDAIRRAQLWNIDYVGDEYDPRFLDLLAHYVKCTLKTAGRMNRP